MKKTFLVMLFAAMVAAGPCFAVDFSRGPEAVQPGSILLSGGFTVGYGDGEYTGRSSGGSGALAIFGFSLAVDYALPFFGLTAGAETGYSGGSLWFYNFGVLPIMARLGYHPDLGLNKFDAYALLKLGLANTYISIGDDSFAGLGIGFGLGGRYFVTDAFAVFAELGVDNFPFNFDGDYYHYEGFSSRYLSIGVTFKIGGSPSSPRPAVAARSSGGDALALAPESDFRVSLGADNKSAVITGYNGRGGSIMIPDTIQGMPVIQIAEEAFREARVTEVVVPEGVTAIGANAFVGCSRLTRVTLPSTIRSIGSGAFNGCGGLAEVNIPAGTRIVWNGNTFIGSALSLGSQALLRELGYTGGF